MEPAHSIRDFQRVLVFPVPFRRYCHPVTVVGVFMWSGNISQYNGLSAGGIIRLDSAGQPN
jgi:hypothetical protein